MTQKLVLAGSSQQLQLASGSLLPGHSLGFLDMQPMPSTFSRSPASGSSPPKPAPGLVPQDWLRQSEALAGLGSLLLRGPGSEPSAQPRELYRVDLQVLPDPSSSVPFACCSTYLMAALCVALCSAAQTC